LKRASVPRQGRKKTLLNCNTNKRASAQTGWLLEEAINALQDNLASFSQTRQASHPNLSSGLSQRQILAKESHKMQSSTRNS